MSDGGFSRVATIRRWLPLIRIPLILLGIALFLGLYNRFLLDVNLRNLKSSLSILDAATGVGQAEAALLLVDQTLVGEMTREELDLKAVAALQYVQGSLSTQNRDRPVEDAQLTVDHLFRERETTRAGVLRALDGIASRIQQTITQTTLLPRQIFRKPASQEINTEKLAEGTRLERIGLFPQAAGVYEDLLKTYPEYAGRTGLKLRLGYLYQRTQNFERAAQLYREALREGKDPQEIAVSRELLARLDKAGQQRRLADRLEERLRLLGAGGERQQVASQLGSLWVQLLFMEKAADAFHQATLADPEGKLAVASLFKKAWSLKYLGRFEEAQEGFQEVIRRDPSSGWATASHQQIAEMYKAKGKVKEAMHSYEELLMVSKEPALEAMILAQAGFTALYDMNDPDQARGYFEELASHFPASPLSTVGRDLLRLQAKKTAVPESVALTPESPLFGWMEHALPLLVETFAKRLARYMEVTEEKELTRKYTEKEFVENVLRRVQELRPGQIQIDQVKISSDGYRGSGTIRVGSLAFPIEGRIGIVVAGDRPHVAIHEAYVWKIPVPEGIRKRLSQRVNKIINNLKLPLKVSQYELKDGYALISVELIE